MSIYENSVSATVASCPGSGIVACCRSGLSDALRPVFLSRYVIVARVGL